MDTATPYRTLDEVVAGLDDLEQTFRAHGDRLAIFATLYGVVSREVHARIAARAFHDPDWVHEYAVAFANLYREAIHHQQTGQPALVPRAWQLAFDLAASDRGLVLQHMMLGVNAHVNNDLPFALTAVGIDPDRLNRYSDHAAVNAVLASVTDRATERLSILYAPGIAALDACAGELDETLSLFSLDVARESAWDSAVSLANARNAFESGLAARLIASRAAVMARLLRAPSLSPALIDVCRHLEQGCDLTSLLSARLAVQQ